MTIYRFERVFTIGRAPFVAGAIHVRNQMRLFKQREKARRRKAMVERFSRLHTALVRRLSFRATGTLDPTPSAASAHA